MFKARPATIKAAGTDDGLQEGQFRALVSVFGNVDSYGDKVMPGAFSKTLAAWAETGDPIPIYWSHQLDDPDMNIGWVNPGDAQETADGLEVLGQLDVPDGSPKAAQVYRLMKGRRVGQFSFAYDVVDAADVDGVNELRELKLYEVGPTPIGANDQTELLAVKRWAEELVVDPGDYVHLKLGRTISAKNESALRDAVDGLVAATKAIKNVLASIGGGDSTDDGKANHPSEASGAAPVNAEEPPTGAKAEEPNRHTSVETWVAHINLSELEGATPWEQT